MADWDIDDVELQPEDILPNGTRILLKRLDTPKAHGKIIIPETSQQPQFIARVCAVGMEVTGFQVGDYVIIGRWNTSRFRLRDTPSAELESDKFHEYALIDQDDIYGKVLKDIGRDNGDQRGSAT